MADRVVTRDPNITPEERARRRLRMTQAAEQTRRDLIAHRLADALTSVGPAMTLAEFAAALDDPDQIPG